MILPGYQTSDSASSSNFHHLALLSASVPLGWLSRFNFCHPIVRSLGVVHIQCLMRHIFPLHYWDVDMRCWVWVSWSRSRHWRWSCTRLQSYSGLCKNIHVALLVSGILTLDKHNNFASLSPGAIITEIQWHQWSYYRMAKFKSAESP